ncbi:hypothetical protein [Portibacter lacus]|uniref:Uncharacterized protein n=1 Tax=Portibacter lacus TaxID=1099794 RepID=A0AA37WBX5_9BACT|nr:hypothetical protein [Portibacter lacus]GLR15866.1 hypothetical protein GCM10007940_04810 [Portibacter lacus]
MKTIALSFSAFYVLIHFASCNKDLGFFEKEYPGVESELWEYYEEFEFQAEKRGLTLDLSNLKVNGEISEIEEPGVAGSCQYGSAINNHITIDKTFWDRSSNLNKEFVVFHELGHCVLFRGHDESQNSNGLCLSIMRSGIGTCIDAYSDANRESYLNELFVDLD